MVKAIMIVLGLLGTNVDEAHVLVITTFDGEVFEAGSGDTCADAFKGAVFPADWREVHCEVAYLVR